MKRPARFLVIICVALLVVGLMAPTVVQARKGAVNQFVLGLRLLDDDVNAKGNGGDVGRAIANTTADGKLIVVVHLDSGNPGDTFTVRVWYDYSSGNMLQTGTLNTNGKGKGNAHVVATGIPPLLPGTTDIQVQVVLDNGADIVYASDFFAVPVKK